MDTSQIPHINGTPRTPVAISPESERKIRHLYKSDFLLFEALNDSRAAKTGELIPLKGRSLAFLGSMDPEGDTSL